MASSHSLLGLRTPSFQRPKCATCASTGSKQAARAQLLKDAKTQAFVQWCTKNLAVSNDKLEPAVFVGEGRGMAASKAIQQEDLLISIPRASAIVLAPKQACPCTDFVTKEYWGQQPWFVKLAVMLLYEQRLGAKSRLAPYIEQLPSSFEAPVLWAPPQLAALQYPALISKVEAQRREWEQLHAALSKGLVSGQAPVSREQLWWAMSAVRSRTFSGPYIGSSLQDRLRLAGFVGVLAAANILLGLADVERTLTAVIGVFVFNVLYEVILSRNLKQYAMAPLLDFINHASDTKSEVSLDYFTDKYSVMAGRAFAAGEQVFISYGQQSNDSLLQYYGFVESDNPADTYVMTRMLQWLPKQMSPAAMSGSSMKALESAGLKAALETVSVARTGFPGPTLQALRYLQAVAAGSSKIAQGPGAFAEPGSNSEEQQLAGLLAGLLNDELDALGSSLADDQAALKSGKPGPPGSSNSSSNSKGGKSLSVEERLALQFRVEKKKVLHAALASLGAAAARSSRTQQQPTAAA